MSCFKERFFFCGAMAMASLTVAAIEYQWVPGATDWTDPASYTNTAVAEVNTSVPGAGDVVAIPAGCTATLDCDNSADLDVVNSLSKIRPLTSSSYFVVVVSAEKGEVTLMPKVNFADSTAYEGWYLGGIVKKGSGTLILGSGGGHYDYFTDITVEKGTLKLPQNASQYSWRFYDMIAVSNGATLFTCADVNKAGAALTAPFALVGEGVVTNDCSARSFLEVLNNGRVWSHEFAGQLTGNIMLNNGRSYFNLTGTNNTFYGGIMAMRDDLNNYPLETVMIGLKKIGKKSDAASSAGKYNSSYRICYRDTRDWNRNHGSGYLYLGDGETTDKDFYVHATDKNGIIQGEEPNFFNAGAYGGITFTGTLAMSDGVNHRFMLTGSNINECVVAGPITRKTVDGTNYNWRIIKRGTGAWRFADVANTEMEGVFAVENGSLRYDSIAEAGTRCALGYSTQLLEDYTGKVDDNRRVDYAFELGSTTDAAADPIFEYTGSAKGWCFSRPIALKGNARLRNSGGELRLANLRTLNATPKTLTLDGEGGDAWLFNVADSYGTLSLVKDGTNTWTVAGTNQISGSIIVKGGTLNLRHHEAPYTWFRWTHKQTCGNWLTCDIELGIYDADGARINSGLTYNSTRVTDAASAKNLGVGEVALSTTGTYRDDNGTGAGVANLFDNDINTQWETAHYPRGESTWRQAYINDATSWFGVVMHLPDNVAAADSYDVIAWGDWSYRKVEASRAFSLEGSFDGVNWYPALDDHDRGEGTYGGKGTTWCIGGETYGNGDAACKPADIITHTTGQKIAGFPAGLPVLMANVTNISVAAGARLAVMGGVLELPSGITLTVDGASGAGTLANMVFPANGTLEIVNAASISDALELPFVRENVFGFENVANWNLVINGSPVPSGRIKCRTASDKIVLYRPGTIFTLR